MNWKTVYSTVEPSLLDLSTSSSTAYIRKDVKQIEPEENNGNKFEYQELKLPINDLASVLGAFCESLAATKNDVAKDGEITQGGLVDIYLNQFEILGKLDQLLKG